MALYESLTASSTPTEIARAYAELASGAGGDTQQNQDTARAFLQSRGIDDETIGASYELYTFQAQTDAMLRADEEAFNRSRAEIEALTRQEEEEIQRQTAEYEAAQARLQAEAQAQAQAAALEQAMIQRQLMEIQAQQAAAAEKFKADRDEMQRTSAAKQAAAKKAGRSAGARPLLGAATPDSMGQGGQSLGNTASLSGQSGSLGAQQTLGVGA